MVGLKKVQNSIYINLRYSRGYTAEDAAKEAEVISRGLLGDVYDTLTGVTVAYGYTPSKYWYFREQGYSHEEVLSVYGGVSYKGDTTLTMSKLYKLGYTNEDICYAFEHNVDLFEYKPYTVGVVDHLGNTFKGLGAMAEHYGLSLSTLTRRLEQDWSLEDALTMPVKKYKSIKVDHLGKEYPTFKAMCKAYGLETSVVYKRLNVLKYSLEDALTIPKHGVGCKILQH